MRRAALLFLALCVVPAAAFAQTTRPVVSASLGFSGVFKPDNWTPIYVRISDHDAPRSATIEVRATRGKLGHDVVSRISTTREPTTFTLYAPLGTLDRVSLQIRDSAGRTLNAIDLSDAALQTPAALGGPAFGIAGSEVDSQRIVNQLFNDTGEYAAAGAIDPRLLPERVIGYGSIDCLVLPGLDTDAMADEVQAAIVSWVRSGGIVVTWPGARAATRASTLGDALPASVGLPEAATFQGHDVVGRHLDIRDGSAPLGSLVVSPPLVVQHKLGLGQIVMLAFDPSRLPLATSGERVALWRLLVSGQLSMSPDDRRVGVFDPLVAQAVGEQQLDATKPVDSPTRMLFGVAFLLGVALGPAELVVLAAAGLHPRRWYTLVGVGMTVLFGAGWLLMPAKSKSAAQERIDVRFEAADGLAASTAIATFPDLAMQAAWLTADRIDPAGQPASELHLSQRQDQFLADSLTAIGGRAAKVRAIRFAGESLHPAQIVVDLAASRVTNASKVPWDAYAVISRDGVRMVHGPVLAGQAAGFAEAPVMAADNASTRRVETGIERLAAEAGWSPILMDRRLSERLVRMLETGDGIFIAGRSTLPDGSQSFIVQAVR